jgi:DNA-binding transcriptional ArsR family regulator
MVEVNPVKLERPLKALANRRRLAILQYIKKRREASVGEIADALRLSIKATSKHLGILIAADILEREQRSLQVFYRISSDSPVAIKPLLTIL